MDLTLDPDMRFRRYYVLFRKARFRAWWSVFTVPGLEHCSVVEEMKSPGDGLAQAEYCSHIDACYGLVTIQIYWENPEKMISKELVSGRITAVAVIDVEKKHRLGYIPFGLFTCVTIVKAILGLHDWRVQTPQSLLRNLERRGATIVRS